MDISGRLVQVLPIQTGAGKNGQWKKCDFVVETADKFPKKICFSAWGELCDQVQQFQSGLELKISFDLNSREYNGRWYTDVRAWKIAASGSAQGGQNDIPLPTNEPPESDTDDLPF